MSINDHQKKAYKDQMGQKALVEREDAKGTVPEQGNQKLREIGESFSPLISSPTRSYEYVGSAAVHVYRAGEVFKSLDFATQTVTILSLPEHVASTALDALRKDLQAGYGRDPQTLRSGF